EKGDDALGDAMNVHRVRAVMKVSRRAIFAEKVLLVEGEAASHVRFKFTCLRVMANGVQGTEVVAGVEIIDPSLRWRFAVVPRTIRMLLPGRVARNSKCRAKKLPVAGVFVYAAQQSASKKICVVNLISGKRKRITQTGRRPAISPIEFVKDVLCGA